ncbi:GTPase HflX [Sporosarcina koreensis]|uniref:GTPase HflX n=1 Tax=Sporosarcina koreensis TaxID=334735 RepID=UPI00058B46D0|nr:GTPase HflX [Sporosarcina koreensis]
MDELEWLEETALLVGVEEQQDDHFAYEMEELANLAEAVGVRVIGRVEQKLERKHPTSYIGKGKIEEVKRAAETMDANLIIFNDELSPSQLRNLERDIEVKIIDRTMLILDIFARRARTREARMQVELAELQYTLPRLVGLRASLSRQGGGTGGGFQNKGAGETKLELDRRKIEEQISKLGKELETMKQHRTIQRQQRVRSGTPVVSIVGYTNAGKSTLMNRMLAMAEGDQAKKVLEKDMLFATLDTSVRKLTLPDHKSFILTDTVGFVSKLPHHLVKAFRSTLEEAREADLLLHVVDVSNPEYRHMIDVTNETLEAVGVEDVPVLYVYNKADQAEGLSYPRVQDDQIWLSAKTGDGMHELTGLIEKKVYERYSVCKVLIPFDRGDLVAYLNDFANVKDTDYEENGTLLTVEMEERERKKFNPYMISH